MTIEPESEPQAAARRGGYAFLVAAGIFLSRIAGLVRQGVLSYFLGTSTAATAFTAAMRIPNFLQNLLGEGVLSASLIPVYSKLLARGDEKTAGRVAGTVASLLALVTAAIVAIGIAFAPLLVSLLTPGFEGETRLLTIRIVRIIFPGIGVLVLSAWCLGVLNSHRSFFVPYVAPVLLSLSVITALLIFAPGESLGRIAVIAAWGVVAGAVLQFGVQVPFVLRRAVPMHFGLELSLEPVRQVFRNFGPVVIGRGVVQVSAFVDEIFASYLTTAAMAAIGYAYTIYLLPFSLFGMAVSAAELPEMSSAVGTPEEVARKLRERVRAGLRQIAFFVVPSVVAFLTIGNYLVAALYQRGVFSSQSTLYVWYILIGYSVGLLAGTLSRLYSSAFYAMNDTRTPLLFALIRVTSAAALGWLLAFPLRGYVVLFISDVLGLPLFELPGVDARVALGAVGLAFASGVVSWLELGLLRRALQKRIGPIPVAFTLQMKLWGSALIAATGSIAFARLVLVRYLPDLHPIPAAVGVAGIFGTIYLGLALVLGVPEVGAIRRRFRR
ncbi:MAG: murein biosynthesis integral membrane protein MurJ [Thermoanaerobaculia bacterium]